MAEDVSEQLTTIEETILKIANQEKRNCGNCPKAD
jgi:hypothetical protein